MITRRRLLGLFGVSVALPYLESFGPKQAQAGTGPAPFAIFVRGANGVVQKTDEPEMWWPSKTGTITKESLLADSDRALSELADHADRLIMVKGIHFKFPMNGCGHTGGGNQCMTAAKVSSDPAGNKSLAMGESIDNRIAVDLNPEGVEPLTLYAGAKGGYVNEVMSYRGPKMIRAAEHNPYKAYMDLFGLSDISSGALEQLQKQRKSVNDLVRDEMKGLLSRNDLSSSDKDRLDLHFQSIRDLENTLVCSLPAPDVQKLKDIEAAAKANDNVQIVTRMQMDIITLAMACGVTRAATLQVGDGLDGTQFTLNGVKQKSFHRISHRIDGDGTSGAPIPDAYKLHHEIDRIQMRQFKYLLDKLTAYDTGSGKLIDAGVTVWLNDLGDKYHSYNNVPYILAGNCAGYFKTGQFVDLGKVFNNKLLSTIGAAVGCKNGAGGPLDDFGDPSLEKGLISQIIAS
jgi:hypothetical protein